VWCQLDELEQKGGAPISTETLDGNIFDAITYSEDGTKTWEARSEWAHRFQPFPGSQELKETLTTQSSELLQLTITYGTNQTGDKVVITCYRNGKKYGSSYVTKVGPLVLESGGWHVVLGLRHSVADDVNAMDPYLRGRIYAARVYNRALTEDEVNQFTFTYLS